MTGNRVQQVSDNLELAIQNLVQFTYSKGFSYFHIKFKIGPYGLPKIKDKS